MTRRILQACGFDRSITERGALIRLYFGFVIGLLVLWAASTAGLPELMR